MNQKNFKTLKIKNNNMILEQGSEYGSLGVKAFKDVAKAVGGALKQTYNLMKTYWDLSFGYLINATKGYYKNGFKGIQSANREFLNNNAKNISDMDALNKAQPGMSDLNFFVGMTAPGALGFEAISSKIVEKTGKSSYGYGSSRRGDDKEKEKILEIESKKAFYNIVMTISHISDETSVDAVFQNINSKVSGSMIKKSSLYVDEEALDNYGSNSFLLVCSTLLKINNTSSKALSKTSLRSLSPTKEIGILLNMIEDDASERKVIKHIKKEKIHSKINSYCDKILGNDRCIDKIKEMRKQLFDSYTRTDSAVLSIHDSKIDLLIEKNMLSNLISKRKSNKNDEEEEPEESDALDEESFNMYKEAMEISFSKFYMASVMIVLNNSYNRCEASRLSLQLLLYFVKSMTKSGTPEESEINKIYSEINDIAKKTKNNNSNVKSFNKTYKTQYEIVDAKEVLKLKNKKISDFTKQKTALNDAKSDEERELLKAKALLNTIEEFSEDLKSIDYDKEYTSELESSIKIYEITKNEVLDKYSSALAKHKDIVSDLDVNVDVYTTASNDLVEKITKSAVAIKKANKELIAFTKKQNEIKSIIKTLEDEISNSDSASEDVDEDGIESEYVGAKKGS